MVENIFNKLINSVYLIARGRKVINSDTLIWYTLGTGFLVGHNKFITCSHVMNDMGKDEFFQHRDGDLYYLINNNQGASFHWHILINPKLNEDIYLYPEEDIAFIRLQDNFYGDANSPAKDKNDYIKINKNIEFIGTEIGVIGFPLCRLEFETGDIYKPKWGNLLVRADKGVINTRLRANDKMHYYEFTIAFNPGNSGGPIFNMQTGELISIVKGYKIIPIDVIENYLQPEYLAKLKEYNSKSYITQVNATYSVGVATPSFIDIFTKHGII